jgi:hypothetical protein
MSRRLVGSGLAVASLLMGMPSSHAVTTTERPRAVCPKRIVDQTSDATIDYNPHGENMPSNPIGTGQNVASLDLKTVTLRLGESWLSAYVEVANLPTTTQLPAYVTAYKYHVDFMYGDRTYTFEDIVFNPNHESVKNFSFGTNTFPLGRVAVPGKSVPNFEGVEHELDDAKSMLIIHIPRAAVEAEIGATIPEGAVFDTIHAWTAEQIANKSTRADSEINAVDTSAEYVVGDDYCFGPPPAAFSGLSGTSAYYTDTATIKATLKDEGGAALVGKSVELTIGSTPPVVKTVNTGSGGVATFSFTTTLPADDYPLTIRYAGDDAIGKATLRGTFKVKEEPTKFSAPKATSKGTSRTVTVYLTDDDGHAVAKQKVDWYVGGKKFGKPVTTDSKGKAVLKTVAGKTVQARFAGLPDRYLSSKSASKKV